MYEPALAEVIRSGNIKSDHYGVRDDFARVVERMLDQPAFQYVPLPQALRFHKSIKRFRWALGGNRASKSVACGMEVLFYALGIHPFRKIKTPNTGWYCTQSWPMVGDILWGEKMEIWLKPLIESKRARVVWHNRGKGIPDRVRLQVPGGESQIIFKSYDQGPGSFQGTERRYIANDEQFPQHVFIEQISRVGAKDELDFFCAMTPIQPQPWLEDRLTVNRPDSYDVFEFPIDDNRISRGGFILDSEIDALISEWPEEVQETRRNGRWGSFLGAVYKTFNRDVHVIHERDESKFLGSDEIRYQQTINSIDFGAADPFVCLWAARLPSRDNAWYVYDEYYWDSRKTGVRLVKDHADAIRRQSKHWNAAVARTWSDHDPQIRAELQSAGIPCQLARKSEGELGMMPGIEAVQSSLKHGAGRSPHLYFSSRCRNTIREMSTYRWRDETPTRDPGERPLDKWNHGPDCVRYLIASESAAPSGRGILAGSPGDRRRF